MIMQSELGIKEEQTMPKLFIYYSLSGNGDVVADYLKSKGFEIRKVNASYKLSKVFFFAMMKGGFDAGRNKKAKLIDYDPDLSAYEEVVIGSPIWNGRLTPPINTVLDKTDLGGKKLTFILYSGSGYGKQATEKLNGLYPSAKVINIKQPKDDKNELIKTEV